MGDTLTQLNSLRLPLNKDDIEVRISTQQEKFFSFLLYKTARVDEKRLSESGLIWENDFSYSPNGDLVCKIKYFDERINQWVTRMDTGTDGANARGQANKGLFSDAFKRAGFKFGIGAELYTMSNIDTQVWADMQMYTDRNGNKRYNLPEAIQYEKLFVSEYEVKGGQIVTIEISCSKGVIFSFRDGKKWTNNVLLRNNNQQQQQQSPQQQQQSPQYIKQSPQQQQEQHIKQQQERYIRQRQQKQKPTTKTANWLDEILMTKHNTDLTNALKEFGFTIDDFFDSWNPYLEIKSKYLNKKN